MSVEVIGYLTERMQNIVIPCILNKQLDPSSVSILIVIKSNYPRSLAPSFVATNYFTRLNETRKQNI